MKPVLVLTTVDAAFDAGSLARELVDFRLAACVNIVDGLRSIYRWQGKIDDESEKLLIIKTVDEHIGALKEILFSRHPYEVPEFVILPIERIEGPYRDWLIASVSPS
ncbi:MAG TPA: divalent-cation tolerance protein CutA [Thermoanaerobaculia bacterium]|nr:divalent-cation tolerance protein CutA [Thermoanaerobaculia bacterium]